MIEKLRFQPYRKYDPSYALEYALGEAEFDFSNPNVCHTGGGSSGSSAPANTTANNTDTVIQQAPAYSQQYISNLLGQAATSAAQPYQQFQGPQVAGFTDPQTQAFSQIENLVGNGTGDAAATQGAAANNLATAGANTANTIASSGSPYLQASAAYNPAAAASPYMQASAATNTPQGISAYMSPYLNSQLQGISNLAQQNWNQFTAPSINSSFIGAGQGGSGRNAQVIGQQANLAEQALTSNLANAAQSAYTTAGNQANAAASNLSGLGNLAGTTAASEATNLQNIGTGLGNLASTQAAAQGNAATNLANTANAVQNTGITGASALQAVGQQQQNLAQQNINTAISNFNAQNLWPETQESFMNSIINGLPSGGSSTTSAGQTPTTTNMLGSTSPLGTLAGSLIGAGAVGKKGGLVVKGYADGGQVSGVSIPDNFDPSTLSALLGLQQVYDVQGEAGMNDQPSSPLPSNPASPADQQPDQSPSPLPQNTDASPTSSGISIPNPPPSHDPSLQADVASSSFNPPPDLSAPREASSIAETTDTGISEHGETTPTQDSEQSPLSSSLAVSGGMPQLDPNKMRQYQLLEMAKGFLTPAHSGAEALGNAVGNYAQSGTDFMKWQQE